MADSLQSAFNNINNVKFVVKSQWGVLTNANDPYAWSAEDVVIDAQPGNDGNAYNAVFGSGGDVLLSATPLVNIWTVTVHFLYKSKTYAMFSYLEQLILATVRDGTKPGWLDISLKDYNDVSGYEESLESAQSMLLSIPSKQWGARPSGDSAFSFLLCNATYLAPGYDSKEIAPLSSPDMGTRNNPGKKD